MNRINFCILAICALMFLSCDSSQKNTNGGSFTPIEFAPDEVMLSITQHTSTSQMSQYLFLCGEYALEGNGAFLYVMGDCRYYVFSPEESPSMRRWWADVYTGTLSETECQAFQEEMMVGWFENKCRYFSNAPHKTLPTSREIGNYISDGHGWVSCSSTCQPTGDDAHFHDIFTNASKWWQHMLDNGVPMESDLRGLLVIADGLLYDYDSFEEGIVNYIDLPEGLKQYAVEPNACRTVEYEGDFDFPRGTIVFPQEYQAWLKEVRAEFIELSRQGLFFPTTLDGIPFKDAEGKKYTLYVRSTIPDLEDENGRLPMPTLCADEDREYIDVLP